MLDGLDDIRDIVRDRVDELGLKPADASKRATGKPDIYREFVNRKVELGAGRLRSLCAALDLEFYVGPPRGAPPPPGEMEIDPDDLAASPSPLPVGGMDVQPWPVPLDGPWFAPVGCAVFGARFLRRAEIEPTHCLTVPVADESMAPTIPKGTFVLADKRRRRLAADRLFLLRWEGGHHVRRATASREFVADNEGDWPASPVDPPAKVVGQIVWYARLLIDLKSVEGIEAV